MKTPRTFAKCRSTNAVKSPNKTGNVRYAESQCKIWRCKTTGDITLSIIRFRDGKTSRVEFDRDEWKILLGLLAGES